MNIFVGCASRNTNNSDYNNVAEKLGDYIVSHKHNLVFGGCEYGLMGKLYETVKQTESEMFITIAEAYKSDLDNLIYTEAFLTQTVNERKDSFIRISDVLVFLPGGIGTIDELMTAIETRRNHEHDVPIIIANINGFFDYQLSMLEKIYAEEFADEKNRNMYVVCSSFEELTTELESVCIQ
ncbi:MAG: TIGR00730 family Rossman fold protein [Clostridia bacterium]|nr:TIGR00730 family Rossman fold protein [Clostridia bacterium]